VPSAPHRQAIFDKVKAFKTAAQLKELGIYPYFRIISSAQDTEVMIGNQKVLMLGSNSYLGLTNHPKIQGSSPGCGRQIWHRLCRFPFP